MALDSPTRLVRCWMLAAALVAAVGCGDSPPGEPSPPPSRVGAPVNAPLECPRGVALCSGVGVPVSGWLPVSGAELQRQDAAQTFRVSSTGWPALVRLVLRRTRAIAAGTQPQLRVEVRKSWGGWLNDRPLASGVLSAVELPCTDDGAGGCLAGNEVPVEIPLVPAKRVSALSPGAANRPNVYALVVRVLPGDTVSAEVAVHGQDDPDGQAWAGQAVRMVGGTRPWPLPTWASEAGDLAFALVLERDRLAGCTDGARNGEETDVDCGGGCSPCARAKLCGGDADCDTGLQCMSRRGGEVARCHPLGGLSAPCAADAQCKSGVCGRLSGLCRLPACANGLKDAKETDVDCGGPCDRCEQGQVCMVAANCRSGLCAAGACTAQDCADGVKADVETDVDCGGPCGGCALKAHCAVHADCASGACVRGACAVATCRDLVLDGAETDVDCGGSCPGCMAGKACGQDADCASRRCEAGACAGATCSDGVKNGTEADVDCGPGCPVACAVGASCALGSDCDSRVCATDKRCAAANCADAVRNQGEPDVDCGGPCAPCAALRACAVDSDCGSGRCVSGRCELAACTDGQQGTGESDVDCGSGCRTRCAEGQGCATASDCATGVCTAGTCGGGSCTDKLRSGDETDVDCGGSCAPCAVTRRCSAGTDCASGACVAGRCKAASCTDGVKNGAEADVDCGGACAPCEAGARCTSNQDCVSRMCVTSACAPSTWNDGVRNGDETDVDCGGSAPQRCGAGRRCTLDADCYLNGQCTLDVCTCPAGMSCFVDPCLSVTCDPNATCTGGAGATCTCNAGYAGNGVSCVDVDECATGANGCDANAACSNTEGAYTCACNAGFTGDGFSCSDEDECALGTHGCDALATCANTVGGYTCTCGAGYAGDGFTCSDVDECATGANACDALATCTNTVGGYTCACNAGYTGDGFTCADVDECALGPYTCDLNASCVNTPGSYACACNAGYVDGGGGTCVDVDECATGTDSCDVNATCTNTLGSYACACNAGYSGNGFSCTDVDECALGLYTCDVNGSCVNTAGSYACACNPGYTATGTTCVDVDECAAGMDSCDVNATCGNTVGSYTCACNAGYSGNGFSCADVNECTAGTHACDVNATCSNTVGSYTCACNAGYSGDGYSCALQPPGAPPTLSATAGYQQVSLAWGAATGATTYNVYRSTGGGTYVLIQSSVSVRSLVDTGLTNGVTYTYVVRGQNSVGEGPDSPTASATPVAPTATLAWTSNGDSNGVFYWLGSARTLGTWANPVRAGYAAASASGTVNGCSSADNTASCDPGWATNRNVGTTANKANADDVPVSTGASSAASVTYDLGSDHVLSANRYTLRSRCDAASSYPRYWTVLGSNDGVGWTTLTSHSGDTTLASRCAWGTWSLPGGTGYRYFRIALLGSSPWSVSPTSYDMVFDEVEFYGTVTYVPRTAPSTPTGLVATGISKGATVSWNGVTGALSYNLFTSTDGVTYTLLASGITTTSRTVTGLTPNSLRYFKVQASNLGGVSAQSAAASATALP